MTRQMPNPNTPPKTVASLAELAAFCGVSITTVRNWKNTIGFPVEPNGEYSPFRVGQWHAMKMVNPSNPKSPADEVDDEENIPSPMLERLRKERWLLARMDRKERENGLVARDRMHSFVMRIANLLRNWTDRIQRQLGEEAYDATIEILDDIESETDREFGDDDRPEFNDEEDDPLSE